MKKTRIKVKVAALQLNEGQLGWLTKTTGDDSQIYKTHELRTIKMK